MTPEEQLERFMAITTSKERAEIIRLCIHQNLRIFELARLRRIRKDEVERKREWADRIQKGKGPKIQEERAKKMAERLGAEERKHGGRKGMRSKDMEIDSIVF